MGLKDQYDRHVADRAKDEAQERATAERRAAEMAAAVRAVVEEALRKMARDFGEDITFLDINSVGYPLFANVGGLTLAVQPLPEAQRQPIELDPLKPRKVLEKFAVDVVAFDKDGGRIVHKRLRVLEWIRLEAVMADLSRLPNYLDPWDAGLIAYLLAEPTEIFIPCEHPVVVASDDDGELRGAVLAGEPALRPCQLALGHNGPHDPTPRQ